MEFVVGVKFFDKCEIQRVLTKNSQVRGVVTAQRMVECRYFVNCAGMVITYQLVSYLGVDNSKLAQKVQNVV